MSVSAALAELKANLGKIFGPVEYHFTNNQIETVCGVYVDIISIIPRPIQAGDTWQIEGRVFIDITEQGCNFQAGWLIDKMHAYFSDPDSSKLNQVFNLYFDKAESVSLPNTSLGFTYFSQPVKISTRDSNYTINDVELDVNSNYN